MALPVEVEKTIAQIDQKIKDLVNARQSLMAAFGGDTRSVSTRQNGSGDARKRPEAADKVVTYLRTHGSAIRAQLVNEAGLPRGSAGYVLRYLLNHSKEIKRVKGKKYQLVTDEK